MAEYPRVNRMFTDTYDPLFEEFESIGKRELSPGPGTLQSVIGFSSKALHHYLLLSEKLIEEKDIRLREKEELLSASKQSAAEWESYAQMLEAEIERLKNQKPEGWR